MFVGVVIFCFCQKNQAQSINGSISINGVAALNAPLGSATMFTNIYGNVGSDPTVLATTGNYTSVPNLTPTLTFDTFVFNPMASAPTDFQLWTITTGSTEFSFDVTKETYISENSEFIDIAGTGTAYIDGFSPTPATWTITGTSTDGELPTFSFYATAVPEPSSLMLLGGLVSLYCLFTCFRAAMLKRKILSDC